LGFVSLERRGFRLTEVSCQFCAHFKPYIERNQQGGGMCMELERYNEKGASQREIDKAIVTIGGFATHPFIYGCSFRECPKFKEI